MYVYYLQWLNYPYSYFLYWFELPLVLAYGYFWYWPMVTFGIALLEAVHPV